MVESARRTGRYSDADRYPLLTLPQFIMLQYVNGKAENWHTLSGYDKFNTGVGAYFPPVVLLVLVVLTSLGVVLFKWLTRRPAGAPQPLVTLSLWAS